VTDDEFVQPVLYTWTTREQIDSLRSGGPLLVHTAFGGSGRSRYVLDLDALAEADLPESATARMLRHHPALIRRRYAWPSPYATRLPRGNRSYGDALIRVELARDALFVRFDPLGTERFRIVDRTGRTAPFDPTKIGAVFHVRPKTDEISAVREFVICNEAMIERWEVGTETIAKELEAERALLLELAPRIEAEPELRALFLGTLAFDNDRYQPTAPRLRALARSLDGHDPTPPGFVRTQASR
jgi:hypothetical protein